jgi:tetratricopeptide (TPR) repeat protein
MASPARASQPLNQNWSAKLAACMDEILAIKKSDPTFHTPKSQKALFSQLDKFQELLDEFSHDENVSLAERTTNLIQFLQLGVSLIEIYAPKKQERIMDFRLQLSQVLFRYGVSLVESQNYPDAIHYVRASIIELNRLQATAEIPQLEIDNQLADTQYYLALRILNEFAMNLSIEDKKLESIECTEAAIYELKKVNPSSAISQENLETHIAGLQFNLAIALEEYAEYSLAHDRKSDAVVYARAAVDELRKVNPAVTSYSAEWEPQFIEFQFILAEMLFKHAEDLAKRNKIPESLECEQTAIAELNKLKTVKSVSTPRLTKTLSLYRLSLAYDTYNHAIDLSTQKKFPEAIESFNEAITLANTILKKDDLFQRAKIFAASAKQTMAYAFSDLENHLKVNRQPDNYLRRLLAAMTTIRKENPDFWETNKAHLEKLKVQVHNATKSAVRSFLQDKSKEQPVEIKEQISRRPRFK